MPIPRITEDLFTQDTFGDFELVFDWRISPGGNSGVKYRIQDHVFLHSGWKGRFEDLVNLSLEDRRPDRPDKGQDYVIGFEYQILDNARNSDARAGLSHTAGALVRHGPARTRRHSSSGRVQSFPDITQRESRGALAERREGGGCGSRGARK